MVHSHEIVALLHFARCNSVLLVGRNTFLGILLADCDSVHAFIEFYMAGEQCCSYVSVTLPMKLPSIEALDDNYIDRIGLDCAMTRRKTPKHHGIDYALFFHRWGTRPYDKKINPVENIAVSIAAMGEGWQ